MSTPSRLKSFKQPSPKPGRWARIAIRDADREAFAESPLVGLDFTALKSAEIPERPVVLERNGQPLFRYGHIVQVFAERGLGKSLFITTLALVMAGRAESMGFSAPRSSRVLLIDGEMSSHELKSRQTDLEKPLTLAEKRPGLMTVAADWQEEPMPRLDTEKGQAAIEPYVEWADVVIVDNRACLFDAAGERDPIVWQKAQRWILDLRRREKLVILIHHTGKNGTSRGISNVEDIIDFSIELARPEDYDATQGARFTMSFGKNRGVYGPVIEPATYALTPTGWVIESSGSTLTALERKILETVQSNSYKTRTDIFDACRGNSKRFYEAFESLEERDILQQTKRTVGKGVTSETVRVWEVNLEIAKKFGFSGGSE